MLRKSMRAGIGGTSNRYASGFNMIGRNLGKAVGSPKVTGAVVKVGNKVTPVLAVIGAFSFGYNSTIYAQCLVGTLK